MHYFRYNPENNTVLTDEITLYLPKIFCLVLLICQKPSNKHKQHQTLVGHTPTSKVSKGCKEKKLLWLEFTTVKPLINTLHAERDASIDRPHFTQLPLNERWQNQKAKQYRVKYCKESSKIKTKYKQISRPKKWTRLRSIKWEFPEPNKTHSRANLKNPTLLFSTLNWKPL